MLPFRRSFQSIYKELEHWETVPNRREPHTLEMLHDHQAQVACEGSHQDSLLAALADWFKVGLFAGLRKSEWAQDAGNSDIRCPQLDVKNGTRAFCLCDIHFESQTRRRYSAIDCLSAPANETVVKCWITFRTQKNGEHGEEHLFTRNKSGSGKCFIAAMEQIIQRFVHLRGSCDTTTPLALYCATEGATPKLITAAETERVMRNTAARVCKLDPRKDKDKKALQRWSSHSLRAGTCAILHAMGYAAASIEFLLRWKSDAFMAYLHNLTILADRHTTALDKAAGMPHFL